MAELNRFRIDNHSHPWRNDGRDEALPLTVRPPDVYVCICNGITDKEIRQAVLAGCRSVPELTMRTGCGATCGSCLDMASDVLREAQQQLASRAFTELEVLSNAA